MGMSYLDAVDGAWRRRFGRILRGRLWQSSTVACERIGRRDVVFLHGRHVGRLSRAAGCGSVDGRPNRKYLTERQERKGENEGK